MNYDSNNISAIVFAGVFSLIVTGLFCKSLNKTLNMVEPENRMLSKLTVWLLMVPGLNLILNFLVVKGLADSISKELEERNFEVSEKPGFNVGIAFAIVSALLAILGFISVPEKYSLAILALAFIQIIVFIQYWLKIRWYRSVLQNDGSNQDLSIDN